MTSAGRGALEEALVRLQEEFGAPPERLVAEVSLAVTEALVESGQDVSGLEVRLSPEGGRLEVVIPSADPAGIPQPLVLSPAVVGRAARIARAKLGRELRDSRLSRLADEAVERRGQLMDAVVERRLGDTWLLRAGHLQAFLGQVEQIPGERLRRGQHVKVVLMESRRGGPELVEVRASRTSPLLLRRLLEVEVPELGAGTVVIRGVAREPGVRAKVAVESRRPGVDPKGACIGPRGTRIRAVVGELAGEEVDIIEWAEDPAIYVARALAPAEVISVRTDLEARRASIVVAPQVLSLAIGKEGRNARLAARLTGWRIDIRSETAEP